MGLYDRDYVRAETYGASEATASFASQVYGWMTIGLGVTAVVAWALFRTGLWMSLVPFWWVFALATLGVGLAINARIESISFNGMAGLFLTYSALEGAFFGSVLPLYAAAYGGGLIWVTFATAATISGLAMGYGMLTRSDLTGLGRLLQFGLMSLIGISVVYFLMSFFVQVTWMHLFISYLGLGIFLGLTAYDAQQIRQMSYQAGRGNQMTGKLSLLMALKMYINVIMVFWYLLQIFAAGRER